MYLKSIWSIKNISYFDINARETCEFILSNKIFNQAEEFLKWLNEKRKWHLYPLFTELIYLLEIGNSKRALDIAMNIENLVLNKWSKLEQKTKSQKHYIEHLKKTISQYATDEYQIIKYLKILQLKSNIIEGSSGKIKKNDIIEIIILSIRNLLKKMLSK